MTDPSGSDPFVPPIELCGVRVHNLQGIDLDLPRNRMIVMTGVSGSGKSSLAFDTLYAEGQRRYIETFSAYTRQFLQRLDRPEADRIEGIPPAIAVAQGGHNRRSSRSTVATVTEIHDYLALLYGRAGRVFALGSGKPIVPSTPVNVVEAIERLDDGQRYLIAAPMDIGPSTRLDLLLDLLREEGFTRVRAGTEVVPLEETERIVEAIAREEPVHVLVDRLIRGRDPEPRRTDSIETAFRRGLGRCDLIVEEIVSRFIRGWIDPETGDRYIAPQPRLFQMNSPLGACPRGQGLGGGVALDPERIVPNPGRSIRDGALAPWSTPAYRNHLEDLLEVGPRLGIPTDLPFEQLNADQVALVYSGSKRDGFLGLQPFFDWLERKAYKTHVRVFLSRFRTYRPCPECGGLRLRPEARAVQIDGLAITDFLGLPVGEAQARINDWIARADALGLTDASRMTGQIASRLEYLERVGLGYLTLDRSARTLSGGESQRVALTQALGSGLVNMLYVLDEPTIGLHPRDSQRLVEILQALRDRGNTLVVVEHEPTVMRAADQIVDIGPGAGQNGGTIVFQGPPDQIATVDDSPTGRFFAGTLRRDSETARTIRTLGPQRLRLRGARGHNLQGVDLEIPLGALVVVSGVSGSGKTTLVQHSLYPALASRLGDEVVSGEPYDTLEGFEPLKSVALVDQSPIGRTGRSNPVTYVKGFDEIRKLFAETSDAKVRNFRAGHFSFNVQGGRCDACEGSGLLTVEMQFLPDIHVACPDCRGQRYRAEVLAVRHKGLSIADVLAMTVREAFGFFRNRPKIQAKLRPLLDVGLDYLRLGQPAPTLSGGEAQRLKLAQHLAGVPRALKKGVETADVQGSTLFLFDEPTTGLHPADVGVLLRALRTLVDLGHTVVVVEHDPMVLAEADWIVDLGPEAGDQGGRIVAQGPPEHLRTQETHTAKALDAHLRSQNTDEYSPSPDVHPATPDMTQPPSKPKAKATTKSKAKATTTTKSKAKTPSKAKASSKTKTKQTRANSKSKSSDDAPKSSRSKKPRKSDETP